MQFRNLRTFPAHSSFITRFCWSPCGNYICSPSVDQTLRIWDVATGNSFGVPVYFSHKIWKVAWTSNAAGLIHNVIAVASDDAEIVLYNASDVFHLQEMVRLRQHTGPVYSLAWSSDGQHLASGGHDCTIRLWGWNNSHRNWSVHTQFPVAGHQGHRGGINSLDWWRGDEGNAHLISGSQDGTVKVWDVVDKSELPTRLRCHNGSVNSLSCWRGTSFFASAADDGFIFIHTLAPPRTSRVLEGHTAAIKRIDFSADGSLLASKAYDNSVRIWSTENWAQVQLIDEPGAHTADPQHSADWHAGMAFHPRTTHLATLDCWDKAIRIWIPDNSFGRGPLGNQNVTTTYISAKVVLIGRSNVGKTSLLTRLLERRSISHNQPRTTHGMRVIRMDANDFHHNLAPHNGTVLSLAFWDLGGQDHYQLVHQLFLNDTSLALILVDPTRGNEAIDDALRWSQALERHMPNPAAKLLIGSLQDQESPFVDRRQINEFVADNNFAGYLEVSALNGRNIEELRDSIAEQLSREDLASVSRPILFQRIREDLLKRQGEGVIVVPLSTIEQSIRRTNPEIYEPEAVRQVVRQLSEQGLISKANVGLGEEMLILQLDVIERYAGSLVVRALNHPKGIPVVEQRLLASPSHNLPGLDKENLSWEVEHVVMESIAELMITNGLCFRHEGLLVFPTLFKFRAASDHTRGSQTPSSVWYDFTGALDNIYAKLVARLAVSEAFGKPRLWANRIELEDGSGHIYGITRIERRAGFARLELGFRKVDRHGRALFTDFVEDHLQQEGVEIKWYAAMPCSHCGKLVGVEVVQRHVAMGNRRVMCVNCQNWTVIDQNSLRITPDPCSKVELLALKDSIDGKTKEEAWYIRNLPQWGTCEVASKALRVLHLSDLHFSADTSVQRRLGPLVRDLKHVDEFFPAIHEVDYVVICGDFTQKGDPAGFPKAVEFLSALHKELGFSAERVILVPGNHDVQDHVEQYKLAELTAGEHLPDPPYVNVGQVYLQRNELTYWERFKRFDEDLYHAYKLVESYPLGPEKQGMAFPPIEKGIQFMGFNSSWQIDRFHRKRSGINPDAVENALREANEQLRKV